MDFQFVFTTDKEVNVLITWKLLPLVHGLLGLLVTIVAIQAIRKFWPGEEYTWSRWWSYKVGDWFIAGYLVFATVVIQHDWDEGWYSEPWFHLLWVAIGAAITIGIQYNEISSGHMAREVWTLPSEWYHTFMRGFLIYYVGQSGFTVLFGTHREPAWAFWGAVICVAVYFATFVIVDTFITDKSPVTRGNR
jgi:hypothetical protein